mgnify:CR=1 FL=1
MRGEGNPGEYHGISKFDIETGNPEVSGTESYSDVFGKDWCAWQRRTPVSVQ